MKKILGNQDDTNVSVLTAFCEQVIHFFGINVVKQIIEDDEARSALCFVKVLRYALVKTDVLPQYGQLLRGNRCFLTIAPDYTAIEMPFGAQGFEVQQKSYTNRGLARTARSTNKTCKRGFKLEIVSHRCSLLLTSNRSKWRCFSRL